MSALNQQEEVSESSKDDDNNPVAVLSAVIQDGSGDSKIEDQIANNQIVIADVTPKPLEESQVCQTEPGIPLDVDSEHKINDSSVVMEDINIQTENAANKHDTGIQMLANIEAVEESVDSPLTPIKPAENDPSSKETSMHDVSESEIELKWSDGEDEDATPLNDEALKKLDEELGIDDKMKDGNLFVESQNAVTDVPEKPMEFEIAKECSNHVINTEITKEVELNKGKSISKPSSPTEKLDLMDTTKVTLECNNENIESVEKLMSQSDTIVKESDVVMEFDIAKECIDHIIKEKDKEITTEVEQNKEKNISEPSSLAGKSDLMETTKATLESNSENIDSVEKSMSQSDTIVKESDVMEFDIAKECIDHIIKEKDKETTTEVEQNKEKSISEPSSLAGKSDLMETTKATLESNIENIDSVEKSMSQSDTIVKESDVGIKFEIAKECTDLIMKENDKEITTEVEQNKEKNISEPSSLAGKSDLMETTKATLESNSENIDSVEKSMSQSKVIVKKSGSQGEEIIASVPIQRYEQENVSKITDSIHVLQAVEQICEPIVSSVKVESMKSTSQTSMPESTLIEEQASEIINTLKDPKNLIDPGKTKEGKSTEFDTIKQYDTPDSVCDMETERSLENVDNETKLVSIDSISTEIENKNVLKCEIESIALKDDTSKIKISKNLSEVSMETTDKDTSINTSIAQKENTDIDVDKLEVRNDSIKINTEHRINRPDVMLDIPTQEFDIDDFDDTSDKQELTYKPEKLDNDLTSKTVTEIVNQLSKESKDYTRITEKTDQTDHELDVKTLSNENLSLNQYDKVPSEDAEMTPVENVSECTEIEPETSQFSADTNQKSKLESKENKNCDIKVSTENKDFVKDVSQVKTENKDDNTEIKEQSQNAETSSNLSKQVAESVGEKVQTQETKINDETSVQTVPVTADTNPTKIVPEKDQNAETIVKGSEKEATDVQPPTLVEKPSAKSSDLSSDKDKPGPTEPTKSADNIEEPEIADSLGLLAESSKVMDEEEEDPEPEEDADDGDGDDDEDFDPDCEESSNPTGENSEESNPPHSEVDIQEEGIDIEFNNEADKIELDGADTAFDSLLGESAEVPEAETVTPPEKTEVSQDVQEKPEAKEHECVDKTPTPDSSKKVEPRRGSLLADLLTKPRADMHLPEGTVRVDSTNTGVVDLEASSSDDESQAKKDRRETIVLVNIAKQIEEATKPTDVKDNVVATEKPKDNKSKPSEILNLDSDDDDKPDKKEVSFIEKPKEGNQCINYDCTSDDTVPYYLADRMTIAYYGAARRRRRPVCQNCLNVVNSRNEGLVSGMKDLRPLMALRMARAPHTLLEISDSDSEGEEEPVGEQQAKYLEEQLADMLNDVWSKYNMDERLKETEEYLEAQLEKMQKDSEEVEVLLRECQAATDAARTALYRTFEGPRQELPAIAIHDTHIASYSCLETEEEPSLNDGSRYKRRSSTCLETWDVPAKKAAYAADGKRTTRSMHDALHKQDDDRDVSVVRLSAEAAPPDLPPAGEPTKPPLKVGALVYAMKNQYGAWLKGKVLDIQPKTEHQFTMCRVRFEHKVKNPCKQLSARSIAYTEPSDVRMTIGTRVIALFKNSENTSKRGEFYYSGVIAEIPNPVNRYRYLVFFDDGYAQYVEHAHTRLVYESKALVWEEVHPFSRDFVCNYLMKYPERPMVRLHADQAVTVEWNGKWWETVVVEVDAALVQVRFPDARTEWIYRGSTRLQPLFTELQAARRTDRTRHPRSTKANIKTNVPYVEYTRSEDQTKPETNSGEDLRRQRSVAKKSTSIAQQITSAATDGVISRVVFYTPKNSVRPLKMVPHNCGPHCKRKDLLTLADLQTYNPLTKPLLSGWERQIIKYKHSKSVMYRAPCGRRVRNLSELHRYLRAVQSDMAVDLFDFSPATHCLAEFVLSKTNVQKKDLSHGKENIPVPCVNYYDHSLPEFCSYNTERTPTSGVPLNLDPDFLCGCDCEDDCIDKNKCACWKMTLEGARTIGIEGTDVGYQYRRLPEPLPSGIYECNSRCKCKATCLNRVVQNPLQLKLQVFKTLNRGWGIRALNDVPKGAFICIYAGNLLTDATANLDGLNEGDEYLAELDYIEVVEAMKEGYEDDVPTPDKIQDKKDTKKSSSEPESDTTESEEDEPKDKNDIEDGDFQPGYMLPGLQEFNKRLRRREKKKVKEEQAVAAGTKSHRKVDDDCITISDDEEVRTSLREPSRFAAEETMTDNKVTSKYRSIRSYFGKDEACYIMDAKVQGNIGRYLNHSCSPNVFVQNVFVDTHDPRFPWVSFFALHSIRAGTELTWNYNYDIGSVPGKVLYCYCGAPNCRGRLL